MKTLQIYLMIAVLLSIFFFYGCQAIKALPSPSSPESNVSQPSTQAKPHPQQTEDVTVEEKPLFEPESDLLQWENESQGSTSSLSLEKHKFGSWIVECTSSKNKCLATLKVKDKAGELVFGLLIQQGKNGGGAAAEPVITAWLPLGIYLPEPVMVFIGESETPFLFTAEHCWSQGCFASSNTPDSLVSALLKPGTTKIAVSTLQYSTNKKITFAFPQSGFLQAYQFMVKD